MAKSKVIEFKGIPNTDNEQISVIVSSNKEYIYDKIEIYFITNDKDKIKKCCIEPEDKNNVSILIKMYKDGDQTHEDIFDYEI